jgi:hypothetical protein
MLVVLSFHAHEICLPFLIIPILTPGPTLVYYTFGLSQFSEPFCHLPRRWFHFQPAPYFGGQADHKKRGGHCFARYNSNNLGDRLILKVGR